ncbi:hypothetical protein [Adhaeribacter soli]|uniref:Uncharacterized protein n=1 Tax=Adhaeribacter soli TaxID=2607655 RepID=A0A5N1IUU2_9BACT|nr:hypothetical protein [Adhaeribacter soli]KAA9331820.1 hypothetical protein F0P94_13550 [Adhaeribacter soli]
MKQLYFVLIFFFTLNSCNKNATTPDILISGLNKIEQSRYEESVKIVDLAIRNSSTDTLYIEVLEKVYVAIRDKIDPAQNATLVIPQAYKEELNAIVSQMPPAVLFTDSAANLDEYYIKHLLANKNLLSKELGGRHYWIVSPSSSITIKLILYFQIHELAEINSEKLHQETIPLNIALKVKYYKGDSQESHTKNLAYKGTSSQFIKLIEGT